MENVNWIYLPLNCHGKCQLNIFNLEFSLSCDEKCQLNIFTLELSLNCYGKCHLNIFKLTLNFPWVVMENFNWIYISTLKFHWIVMENFNWIYLTLEESGWVEVIWKKLPVRFWNKLVAALFDWIFNLIKTVHPFQVHWIS